VLALSVAASVALGAPAVMDRVVALVEGEVVTLSELEFEARVALIDRGAVKAASDPLDEATLRGALELSIAQRLSIREADRLEIFPLEPAELESTVALFRGRFESEQAFERFLAAHEADVQQLANVLGRALRANRILDSKVRLRAQVSDGEVRRYYEGHRDELGGSYEQVRARLREKLQREKYAQVARAELQKLRRASNVRLIAPFARAEGG
jgi:hypothetical protein